MKQKILGVELRKLTWLEKVWLGAPIAIWFSYQPLIRLGQDSTSYYELSIVLIYSVILALVGLPTIWRARRRLFEDTAVRLVSAFVGFSLLTLGWTPNLLRGLLTGGVIGMLFLIFLAGVAEQERLRKLVPVVARIMIGSAVIVALLAVFQMIAGIWLSRTDTLLCAGCIADQFGFVRPNVFAIEPQFLGSLLLAPLLLLLHAVLSGRRNTTVTVSFLLVGMALFMTLSRGAIFAFALGAVWLLVVHRQQVQRGIRAVVLLIVAFGAALVMQGTAAALNPRVDVTFYGAVSASLNQLSLGIIRLPAEEQQQPVESDGEAPAFDGYVEESTDTRLSLSQLALATWLTSPARMIVGVGLGGSGVAIHEHYPEIISARQIVQNEYIETLLEYGLVGAALFGALLLGFLQGTRRHIWTWAFLFAYMLQWLFFSGYPNALHVYLVLMTLFIAGRAPSSERRAAVGPIRSSSK